MPVRAVCNFVYAHHMSIIDARSENAGEDREKFDGELYQKFGDAKLLKLMDQIGG